MNALWSSRVLPIAALFSFRMLGLFMLIPVFTVTAVRLEGSTSMLMGIALGSYGLSQCIFQIPFGLLSDRVGRKCMLTIGFVLLALGSLLGAISHSIYTMIFARVLQGAGAVGGVLIALLADLTTNEQRTKAMAVIGISIGLSFSLAMVISPAVVAYFGLSGIFYLTAVFAFLALLLLHGVIPTPRIESRLNSHVANPSLLKDVLQDKQLQRLNLGIFFQHFILTATFYSIPILVQRQLKLGHLAQQWHFYLPLMVFSFILMVPFIILAEKKRQMRTVFIGSILIMSLTQLLLALMGFHWFGLCVSLFLYFIAFNILEACLPSLVSKQAAPHCKGTAMGIYSSSQFLGLFLGGAMAGIVYQFVGNQGVFIMNTLFGVFWLLTACATSKLTDKVVCA